MIILNPGISDSVLLNPGKGWVAYGPATQQPTEVLNMVSMGYARYRWGNLEPREGVYNWEPIEKDIRSWAELGKDFAFGVACASTHSTDFWVSPGWVFEAGAKYDTFHLKEARLNTTGVPGAKLVPVFDDPVFMEKLNNFIKAMAEHFDGHPNIAFIDIRSYGNWGEGHMYPFGKPDISADKYREHIEMHRSAFKQTLLVIPSGMKKEYQPLFDWAVSVGIGIRRDGICGNSNGSEVLRCNGKMPGVFELFGHYDLLKQQGWWYGNKDKNGYGYKLDECVETGKPTYCDLSRGGNSGLSLIREEPELIRTLANRLGYHFVLLEARFPEILKLKGNNKVSMKWENRGVTQIYMPCEVVYALLDNEGKLVDTCPSTARTPVNWLSDATVELSDNPVFTKAKKGNYLLAVGITRPNDGNSPSIKLGNTLPMKNGWYELGEIRLK
jgi:hypothetical protein